MGNTALRCPRDAAAHTFKRCAPRSPARTPAQALVELALVMPIMLLLLMGTVEFGRAYVAGIALEGAAREGARLASTLTMPGGDGTCSYSTASAQWCSDVITRVQQAAQPETLNNTTDITICAVTVVPPAAPAICAPSAADSVPTISGQAVTITASTFKPFYISFLTKNGVRWLGYGSGVIGVPIQASSTMRVP